MFDIGFSELIVIGVVALVVIGPEKLPRVARTVGHLMGRMQRYVADVKADIQREAELDELRRMRDSVQSTATDIERSITEDVSSIAMDVKKIDEEIDQALAGALAPPPDSTAGDVPARTPPESPKLPA